MASRIPTWQRQVAPEVAQAPRVQAAQVDSSGLAQGLNQAAGAIFQVQQKEMEEANRTALIDADNSLGSWQNSALYDPEKGAFTKQGKGALGISQSVLGQFDQQQQAIHDSLANDQQKTMFKQAAAQRRASLEQQLSGYEFKQQQAYKDDVDNSSIQLSLDSAALSYNDPQAVAQNRLKGAAVIETRAERLGWSPEEKEAQLQKYNSSLSHAVIQRMVIDSPQKAKGLYEEYKGSMTADDQIRATATIDQAFKRQEAEARQRQIEARQMQALARQELSGRLQDAQVALLNGAVPVDMPTRQEIVAAHGEEKGARIYGEISKLQELGPALQELRTAAPQQAASIVDAHDPIKSAPKNGEGLPVVSSGFKTDEQVHGILARAAAQFQQQREADPAAYAIQTSPAVKAAYAKLQDDPSPENHAAYITASVAEQSRQGVDSPKILPIQQASAIASKLKQSTPSDQGRMLSELSQTYGSAYPKVLAQIGGDAPVQTVAGMVGSANTQIQTQRSGIFSKGINRTPEFIQNTLLTGDEALKSKAYKLPPSTNTAGQITTGPDKAFYEAANGLLDPASMKTYHAAFQSYYAGRAIQEGKYGEAYEPSYAREALAAIGLTPVEIGAGKTLPPYGMDPNAFKDRLSAEYEAYRKSSGTAHSLSDVSVYAGPNSTYVVRDALGNKLTTLEVKP